MKIVHIIPNFYPITGGAETLAFELTKRFVKKGYEVHVVTSDRSLDGKRLRRFEIKDGIKIHRLPFYQIFRYNFSPNMLRLVLKIDSDIIHIYGTGFQTDIIPIIKLFNKKIILTTLGGVFHTRYLTLFKKLYFNFLTRFDLKFVDSVIAISNKDAKLFSKICNKDKVFMITPGLNWRLLRKLKRKSSGNTLLYVGRLSKNKRLDRMIRTLYYMKQKIPNIKLLFVGDDWGEKSKLISLAKKLKVLENVEFLGYVKDVRKIYSISDLFLLSSDYEGFGISVIEAMASGLPVIVNDIESMWEIVENGKNGYIVDFNNHKKTARIICDTLNNTTLKNKLGKYARESSRKYDWSNIVKKVEKIYEMEVKR